MNSITDKKPDRQPSERNRELSALAALRRPAPPGFRERVMSALPAERMKKKQWWPAGWEWLAPSLAGAGAVLLAVLIFSTLRETPGPEPLTVQFEIHAPGAESVDLVGDFTGWQPGLIQLHGPDESGHWTTRVQLPEGRYEYLFLVDGQQWVTDDLAPAHRADGFGNINAIINL